jgi:hypothetical protein
LGGSDLHLLQEGKKNKPEKSNIEERTTPGAIRNLPVELIAIRFKVFRGLQTLKRSAGKYTNQSLNLKMKAFPPEGQSNIVFTSHTPPKT